MLKYWLVVCTTSNGRPSLVTAFFLPSLVQSYFSLLVPLLFTYIFYSRLPTKISDSNHRKYVFFGHWVAKKKKYTNKLRAKKSCGQITITLSVLCKIHFLVARFCLRAVSQHFASFTSSTCLPLVDKC